MRHKRSERKRIRASFLINMSMTVTASRSALIPKQVAGMQA